MCYRLTFLYTRLWEKKRSQVYCRGLLDANMVPKKEVTKMHRKSIHYLSSSYHLSLSLCHIDMNIIDIRLSPL